MSDDTEFHLFTPPPPRSRFRKRFKPEPMWLDRLRNGPFVRNYDDGVMIWTPHSAAYIDNSIVKPTDPSGDWHKGEMFEWPSGTKIKG